MTFKPYFEKSSYETLQSRPRKFLDKLFLNTRWYFVYKYVKEILNGRSLALEGKYNREDWSNSSFNIFNLVEDCGGKIHLEGLDNLTKVEGPFVFISNHMSTLETFILPCIIAPIMDVTFVVKESLVKHKLFGPLMKSRNPIIAKRLNPREDLLEVMNKGKELLRKGTSIVIFPQSTRSVEFNPDEFNSLGIKLAKSTGVKVIPISIKTDFWANGRILKDVGPINRDNIVHIKFDEPFEISGNGKEDHGRIINFIIENLNNWGGIVK